jgi:peptidyl-prolyl cis-trans isomerase C
MINSIQKVLVVALATTIVATSQSPAATAISTNSSGASKIADLIGDPVLAKGKGVEIKRSQLDAEMLNVQAMAASKRQQIPPDQMVLIEREKLNDLIGFQLLLKKANDADKAKSKEQFDKAIARLKKDNKLTDEEFVEKLSTQLKIQKLTRAEWDKQRIDQITVAATLERELKVNITDADAKKFYDENPKRFEQPETVRAAHILLTTVELASKQELAPDKQKAQRALIEALLKRVRAGEDFGKLAKEFSQDPGSKERGGEYVFPRGQMAVEFETAAFSMSVGQISDVVTTKFGYHIIKVLERNAAGKIEFAKVKERVRENLQQEEADKRLPAYLEAVKKEAGVEILDATYK